MQEREYTIKLIYIVTSVMTVVLLLSANSRSLSFVLLTYAFLPIGLLMPEFLIPTYFIASLSSNFFGAAQGVGFTRLLALAIIAGVAIRLVRSKEPLQSKWFVHCVFIAYATIMAFGLAYDTNIKPLYVMGLNILILIAMTNLSINKEKLVHVFRAILLAVIISTVFYSAELMMNTYFIQNGRMTLTESVNANNFGFMMGQMASFCFAYLVFSKKIFTKAICLFGGAINGYFVLMSGSRSALIGVVFGCILVVLISMYVHKRLKKHFLSLVIICASLAYISYSIVQLNPLLLYRMNIGEVISSGGTNRWPRVVAELQYIIPAHPFFGVGLSAVNETVALAQYMNEPGSSHNFIVSALAQVGIIGFIAYMSLFWRIIKEAISQLYSNEVLIIPLMLILTLVFNGIGEVIYSERIFWNDISLAALCLATYSNRNKLQIETFKNSDNTTERLDT